MGGSNSKTPYDPRPQVPSDWDVDKIPKLQGKIAIVTGANSGIGYQTVLILATKGAHVVMACRDETRGHDAETKIKVLLASTPEAGSVELMKLDVGDLASVKLFANEFKKKHKRLDILVNNAGIVGGAFTKSVDGFELQFATNYLGHFALTAELFELLKAGAPSRVITVASFLHRPATLTFNENKIMATNEKEYGQVNAYCVSKLCNLLFTMELNRRIKAAGIEGVVAAAAHPGYCDTKIMKKGAATNPSWFWWLVFRTSAAAPPQNAFKGALPLIYAATADDVQGGDYYGPKYLEIYGYPAREDPSSLSKSESAAEKLWALSEKLTQITFSIKP